MHGDKLDRSGMFKASDAPSRELQVEKYCVPWEAPSDSTCWLERWLSGLKRTPGKREWA